MCSGLYEPERTSLHYYVSVCIGVFETVRGRPIPVNFRLIYNVILKTGTRTRLTRFRVVCINVTYIYEYKINNFVDSEKQNYTVNNNNIEKKGKKKKQT